MNKINKTGKSFGLSHKAYKRVHSKGVCMYPERIPGPGSYSSKYKAGDGARKYSLKGKLTLSSR
jgi:hypothetical protein